MSWRIDYENAVVRSIDVDMPEIVGKQRARTVRTGSTTVTYTPQKTRDAEELIAWQWRAKHGDAGARHEGPVTVSILVRRELAKSNPKKWAGRCDLGKPDVDNVAKLVLDALNGIAYPDDSHITSLLVSKAPRLPHGDGSSMLISVSYHDEEYEED